MEEKHKSGSNGFFLGVIFGAALFYLLGTKSGRKILKELSGKGLNVLEELSNTRDFEFIPEEEDEYEEENEGVLNLKNDKENIEPVKNGQSSLKKRLFKGIKRR